MQFILDSKYLNERLNKALLFTNLSGRLIAEKSVAFSIYDGHLCLLTTNLECTAHIILSKVPATEFFITCVSAELLSKIVKTLEGEVTLIIGDKLRIKSGRTVYELITSDPTNFVPFEYQSSKPHATIPAKPFVTGVSLVAAATNHKDPSKDFYRCIQWGGNTFAATSGVYASFYKTDLIPFMEAPVFLPPGFYEGIEILKHTESMLVSIDNGQMSIYAKDEVYFVVSLVQSSINLLGLMRARNYVGRAYIEKSEEFLHVMSMLDAAGVTSFTLRSVEEGLEASGAWECAKACITLPVRIEGTIVIAGFAQQYIRLLSQIKGASLIISQSDGPTLLESGDYACLITKLS